METKEKKHGNYLKFFAMIATSMVAMFFLMYLNSYQIIDHFWYSETRFFMTLIMGGAMIIIMLLYMLKMLEDKGKNMVTLAVGVLLIGGAVWLVRSQVTVTDVDYMEGMIPHHSIAILTSDRSQIKDARVRELADGIIKAQRREIMEMQWLINDIRKNGIAATPEEKERRPVPKFEGSLDEETKETAGYPSEPKNTGKTGETKYNPPKPEDAPKEIRDVVLLGHKILTETQKNLPDYVGNDLNCHNCHFEGGITHGGKNGGISYVGVAAKYPKYRNRQDFSVDLMSSSVAGLSGTPNVSAYVASKHAIIGLMRSLAYEVAAKKIRVNTINPSPVDNRMMRSLEEGFAPGQGKEAKKGFEQTIPLGRYASSEEVARLVLFLASDDSQFVTGTTQVIDGGMSA